MLINFNKKFLNKKYIKKIIEAFNYAFDYLKIKTKDVEVNINFVSETEIRRINNEFRKKDTKTDVISFPNLLEEGRENMQLIVDKLSKENFTMDINPENNCLFLGDICICKKVAFVHAKEYGNSKLREMVYMAVHGLLHLLGYDHIIEDEKKIMREVEEEIMNKIDLRRY